MLKSSLNWKISVASLAIVFCIVGRLSAQNLVTNPGFESGPGSSSDPVPGWTFIPSPDGPVTKVDFNSAHTGIYGVDGQQFGGFDSISQNLTTVAGQSYDLSFWLASLSGGGVGTTLEFRVWWNGAIVLDRTNDPEDFAYTQVFVRNLFATSSSTALRFDIRNDPGAYYLDDIFVITTQGLKTFTKSGTTATMTIDSKIGLTYQLQSSGTLLPGSFANVAGAPSQAGTGSPLTFTDSNATTSPTFYRLLISSGPQANLGPLKPTRHDEKLNAFNEMKRAERLQEKYFGKPANETLQPDYLKPANSPSDF